MRPQGKHDVAAIKTELDEYGFVVIPNLIPRDDAERMAERFKELMSGQPDADQPDQCLRAVFNYLDPGEYDQFQVLLAHPLCLELAHLVLGEGFQLPEASALWRKPGAPAGPLHVGAGTGWMAKTGLPLAEICFVLTFSWLLNDLTKDNGGRFYMPFSHHSRRVPRPGVDYHHLAAIEAPAGSIVMFNGAVWHAFAPNNTKDQNRVELASGYIPHWLDPALVGWQGMKRSVVERMPEAVQRISRHTVDG